MAEQETEHIAKIKQVEVKLAGRCIVDGVIREKGEIVLIQEKATDGQPYAECYGEIVKHDKK